MRCIVMATSPLTHLASPNSPELPWLSTMPPTPSIPPNDHHPLSTKPSRKPSIAFENMIAEELAETLLAIDMKYFRRITVSAFTHSIRQHGSECFYTQYIYTLLYLCMIEEACLARLHQQNYQCICVCVCMRNFYKNNGMYFG